jgi:hypothetical protein
VATLAPPRSKAYDDTFFKPVSLWLTTTDHKLIGIMYMTTGMLSFVVGGIFALVMRIQLSQPNEKVIDAATYGSGRTKWQGRLVHFPDITEAGASSRADGGARRAARGHGSQDAPSRRAAIMASPGGLQPPLG